MTRAIVGLAALVLVACAGGTESSSSATNPERSESPTSPTPTPVEPAASPAPAPSEVAASPEPAPTTEPTAAGATAESVPESLACATHADCVLVAGVCGGVEPTNRSHEAETRRGIEMRRTVASCAAPRGREPTMVARCNAGACMAIEPP